MVLNFCPLLQRGLCAIFTALLCPDGSPQPPPLPWPVHPLLLFSPDHNRQILQHLIPREISTESFTHLLFLLCPLFPSPVLVLHLSLSLHSLPLSLSPSLLFFCRCRYRARVEKVESPAKVHVFYIDYGNVSNLETMNCIVIIKNSAIVWGCKCKNE